MRPENGIAIVRVDSSDDLLRRASLAARRQDVREAVRDLALQALRSRALTADHIVVVARTVGEGIESSSMAPTTPVRETHRGAWTGLEDAVAQALWAIELAAREVAEGRTKLTASECEDLLVEIAQLENALTGAWEHWRAMPSSLRERIDTVCTLLRQAAASDSRSAVQVSADRMAGIGKILPLVASGVLLGLSEVRREHLDGNRDVLSPLGAS